MIAMPGHRPFSDLIREFNQERRARASSKAAALLQEIRRTMIETESKLDAQTSLNQRKASKR
jgi:hypothetical protein